MGKLLDQIRRAVADNRYLIGEHAGERLDERGIPDWQVVEALAEASLIVERPAAKPNAAVEVEQVLPDGTTVKAVWSWLPRSRAAKLVTVHYFDK